MPPEKQTPMGSSAGMRWRRLAISSQSALMYVAFGEEVAHRAVERAGEANFLAFARDDGEGAVDLTDGSGRTVEDAGAGFFDRQVVDLIGGRVQQVNDAFKVLMHAGVLASVA